MTYLKILLYKFKYYNKIKGPTSTFILIQANGNYIKKQPLWPLISGTQNRYHSEWQKKKRKEKMVSNILLNISICVPQKKSSEFERYMKLSKLCQNFHFRVSYHFKWNLQITIDPLTRNEGQRKQKLFIKIYSKLRLGTSSLDLCVCVYH